MPEKRSMHCALPHSLARYYQAKSLHNDVNRLLITKPRLSATDEVFVDRRRVSRALRGAAINTGEAHESHLDPIRGNARACLISKRIAMRA